MLSRWQLSVMRLVLVTAMVAVAQPALAGWVIKDKSGYVALISGGRIKMATREGTYLLDTRSGVTTLISKSPKVYARGNVETVCNAFDDWRASFYAPERKRDRGAPKESVQARPEDLSFIALEGARSNVYADGEDFVGVGGEGAGGGEPELEVEVMYIGSGGKIAGFQTSKYRVDLYGKKFALVWITKDPRMTRIIKTLDVLNVQALQRCGAGPTAIAEETWDGRVEGSKEYIRLLQLGWVMRKKVWTDGTVEMTVDTIKVEEKSIPDSEFAPPKKKYKKIPFTRMLKLATEDDL